MVNFEKNYTHPSPGSSDFLIAMSPGSSDFLIAMSDEYINKSIFYHSKYYLQAHLTGG